MTRRLRRDAPAKLNLWLRVTGRRPDGYHLLDSLVAFAAVGDTIEVAESDHFELSIDGPFAAGLGGGDDNIIWRAARRLAAQAGVAPHAAIHLHKRLPVASGVGGGSADAAATLVVLADLWGLGLPIVDLQGVAATLGADVPMCLDGRLAYASGVGEILESAPPLPACGLVLVNPGRPLLTADVFRARAERHEPFRPPAARFAGGSPDLDRLCAAIEAAGNDLQGPACALAPAIGETLAALRQCRGVRVAAMSGSGATCFALCADAAQAVTIADNMAREHPLWWTWGGTWA
jgi:4-diphosphocytidyl-2-C-methyl-D-erythritol kinase